MTSFSSRESDHQVSSGTKCHRRLIGKLPPTKSSQGQLDSNAYTTKKQQFSKGCSHLMLLKSVLVTSAPLQSLLQSAGTFTTFTFFSPVLQCPERHSETTFFACMHGCSYTFWVYAVNLMHSNDCFVAYYLNFTFSQSSGDESEFVSSCENTKMYQFPLQSSFLFSPLCPIHRCRYSFN